MSLKPLDDVKVVAKKVSTISEETHMEMFRRLAHPMFNSGAMHGTPGAKKTRS